MQVRRQRTALAVLAAVCALCALQAGALAAVPTAQIQAGYNMISDCDTD